MHPKLLMTLSAATMLLAGLACTFAPAEFAVHARLQADPATVMLVQLIGALYVGFAVLNYMAKDNLIGGIYSRPVALGNFAHFLVFALAAIKICTLHRFPTSLVLVTFGYTVFAIWFALIAFGSPKLQGP